MDEQQVRKQYAALHGREMLDEDFRAFERLSQRFGIDVESCNSYAAWQATLQVAIATRFEAIIRGAMI